ncbi:MAG: polysaccharide pyruvyl transferase family protein [Alphaproteobacteria bacterium]
MNIIIFNMKYSNNLGDGVIAECLEKELQEAVPGLNIQSIDLGGREFYGDYGLTSARTPAQRAKSILTPIFRKLPAALQRTVARRLAEIVLSRKLRPRWREQLKSCEAVILGGGHIFSDVDLYFPVRIHAALQEVRARDLPLAVCSVGVSKDWSAEACRLFSDALAGTKLVHVAVRDSMSQGNWQSHFGGPVPAIGGDPGLLARDTYPVAARLKDDGKKTIGIGIIDEDFACKHGGEPSKIVGGYEEVFFQTVRRLHARGYRVVVFTNGAPEDERLKDRVAQRIAATSERKDDITFMPRFGKPRDLVKLIAGLDGLIAHRLHANIVAYSFGIPHVGLGWDVKLRSFFKFVDRQDYLLEPFDFTPESIEAKIIAALEAGIDAKTHQRVLSETRQHLRNLGRIITAQADIDNFVPIGHLTPAQAVPLRQSG